MLQEPIVICVSSCTIVTHRHVKTQARHIQVTGPWGHDLANGCTVLQAPNISILFLF